MTRKLVRVGSAVLATLAIGGAAATVGVGTAGAAGVIGGISTGSAGWPLDEAMDQLRPCHSGGGFYPQYEFGPCYFNEFRNEGKLGDYRAAYYGPDEVAPGAEDNFTAFIGPEMSAYDIPHPDTDVDVTSVKYQLPEGFEFVGVVVKGAQAGNPRGSYVELPSTVSLDPDSGVITVAAPAGGWAMIPYLDGGTRWESTGVLLTFTLRAPESRTPGRTSGLTFTGTSVPASDGWVATGTTRVWPELADGTGS